MVSLKEAVNRWFIYKKGKTYALPIVRLFAHLDKFLLNISKKIVIRLDLCELEETSASSSWIFNVAGT